MWNPKTWQPLTELQDLTEWTLPPNEPSLNEEVEEAEEVEEVEEAANP